MPTEKDHIDNLRARLQERLREIESEKTEIMETIRVLGSVPKLLGRSPVVPAPDLKPTKTVGRILQNRNVTDLVRQFIDTYERDKAIDIPTLVKDYLIAANSVKGKYRSLYSAVCVILKKETQSKAGERPRLAYEKGVGFYRPKRTPGEKPSDSVLVHSA